MAGFRGVFDGSVEIGQAREARASQMEMQQQRIRADTQMQQQKLSAEIAQANADRSLKAKALDMEGSVAQQKIDLGSREMALREEEFDSGAAIREMQQTNAKMLLQKAQAEFDDDQAMRASQTAFRQSAFGAGILSAMMNGVTATKTISEINAANGIPNDKPGAIIGMGGGPDGAWYDVIAEDGKGGLAKMRQQVDPIALLTIAHSVLGEKGAAEWARTFRARQTNNTRMTIATDGYLKSAALQREKAMAASLLQAQKAWDAKDLAETKAAGTAAGAAVRSAPTHIADALKNEIKAVDSEMTKPGMTKTARAGLEKRKAALQKRYDTAVLGIGDEKTADGAAPAAGAAKSSDNSPSVRMANGSIIVKENGLIETFPDSQDLRDNLKNLGYNFE